MGVEKEAVSELNVKSNICNFTKTGRQHYKVANRNPVTDTRQQVIDELLSVIYL